MRLNGFQGMSGTVKNGRVIQSKIAFKGTDFDILAVIPLMPYLNTLLNSEKLASARNTKRAK